MSSAAPPPPEPYGSDYPASSGEPMINHPPAGPPAGPPPATGGASSAAAPGPSPTSSHSGGMAAMSTQHTLDLAQIGLGALLFIASLLPFYSYSAHVAGFSASSSLTAWHGFFGWFGVLLGVAAAGVLAAALFAHVVIPSLRLLVLGLFAASAVCLILALFVIPGGSYSGPAFSTGHSFGYWLALLCSLAGTALAFLRKDETTAPA